MKLIATLTCILLGLAYSVIAQECNCGNSHAYEDSINIMNGNALLVNLHIKRNKMTPVPLPE